MENIDELLPGIEEYLSQTLATEKLSPLAEQKRLFFLERLDIVKLPPTVPPREGRSVSQELLRDTEEKSGIPSSQSTTRQQPPDFAATQREIARSWRGTGSPVTEDKDELHDGDDDSLEEVKVYDDIDIPDDCSKDGTDNKGDHSVDNPYDGDDMDDQDGPTTTTTNNNNAAAIHLHLLNDDDDDDENGENDYEIPVAMQQLSDEGAGGSHPSLALAMSTEELHDDVLEPLSSSSAAAAMGPPPVPPPLPPRRDIRFSDSGSRSSINGLNDEAPPDLPYRPPLSRRGEMCGRSERSDRSDPDVSGDGDSTSYESFDDEDEDPNNCSGKSNRNSNTNNDTASRNAGIKLPAKPSKKKTLKMSKKMPKSKSLSQWEISAPFRKLDNVDVSGELFHKGKLTWNRRLVAITNGCLAMYKPDKDGRPMSVIPLMGYDATVSERKEKGRSFEIRMTHPQDDSHQFSVDVKEWAYAWKEHINNNSRGQRSSTGRTIRLSRALSGDLSTMTPSTGTLTQTNSNTGSNGSKLSDTFRHSWADDDDYDEICVRKDNVFYELDERHEHNYDGIGECSSLISESRSTPASPLTGQTRRAFTLSRSQAFRASVKSTPEETDERKKDNSISSVLRRRKMEFQARLGTPILIGSEILKVPKSTMSLRRLDWKSVLYNWSTPFDQVIMTLRRTTDLNGSNSNLSTGSEGGRAEEVVTRPRLRSGNKVMRMGSFAFRATQFFENISKKTSVKRKQSSQSYSGDNLNGTTINDGCKPRGVSVGSQDSQDMVSNGNSNNNNHSNILEESSISSNSTSNPPHSPLNSPSSDLNTPVFSDCNSNPSNSPTAVTAPGYDDLAGKRLASLTNEDSGYLQDVTHKGYLFIFSTFNRRRWGKRWCLVRGNYFECYRSQNQPSSQCELSFLLKACVMRRAVMETNSEMALMLVEVESNKEKITVEPVTDREMPAWVQVLMAETSTPTLPEGLEEHMKCLEARRGSDAPSVLSLSVLKQWDMDITLLSLDASSKDNNTSPEESSAPWHVSSGDTSPRDQVPSPTEPLTPTPDTPHTSPTFVHEATPLIPVDNLVPNAKKKHTTDSGFYSVKGNNSDSDGEHSDLVHKINDIQKETADDLNLNLGFSVVESHNFNHSAQTNENNNVRQSNNDCDSDSKTVPSSGDDLPLSCVNNSDECSTKEAMEETQISSEPHSGPSPPVSQASPESSPLPTSSDPPPPSFQNTQPEPSRDSPEASEISDMNTTTAEPSSPNDEYTIVVKRSLRRKSTKPAGNDRPRKDSIPTPAPVIDDMSNLDVMTFGNPKSDEETDEDETPPPLPPPMPPKESIYEEVVVKQNHEASTETSSPTSVTAKEDDNSNPPPTTLCNEDEFDHLIQSLEEERNNLQNRPSTSSISDLVDDPADGASKMNGTESHNPDEEMSASDDVITTTGTHSMSTSSENMTSTPSKLSVTLVSKEKTPRHTAITPISIKSISVSEYPSDGHSPVIPVMSSCHSPELPLVEVHKPGMTEDELREAIQGLKQKKSHLKRKRLAVHDKRQRVSSDEERLACEKEFASLEREVETTDSDIGFLQNQLDVLCGHSLEAIKINNKKKNGSGKKKKSKKKAH